MSKPLSLTQALFSDEGATIQDAMETVHLEDGEVLFQVEEPGDAFYTIDSGQIRIFTLDEEGRELTLNTLNAGEAFGELSLLDDQPRSASASAIGPTVLRRLRRDVFLQRVHTSPVLTDIVIRLIGQRTRHMTDYIELLGHWARLVAEGKYDTAMANIQNDERTSERAFAAVADAVETMVKAVKQREEKLKKQVAQLKIQIDESKRKEQVDEIVDTDFFQQLSKQVKGLQKRYDENDIDQARKTDSE